MASASCRLPGPDPLRKMERQTFVARRFSNCVFKKFAISDPNEFLSAQNSGTVDEEVPLVTDRYPEPVQRTRRRAFDFRPVPRKFAAMARARDNAQAGIPRGQAPEMRADC